MRLRQLRDLGKSGRPSTFITLTASTRWYETPDQMARALVHAWRMVIQRGKREGRFKRLSYLAVFETHKSGFPHLHILARAPWIDQQWLSERMDEYAHGPRVNIQAVRSSRHVSQYVAKYISKGPGRFDGCKRYWRSQDWQQEPTGWDRDVPAADRYQAFHTRYPESLADAYQRVGWSVHWSSWWCFEAVPGEPGQPGPWFDAFLDAGRAPPGG